MHELRVMSWNLFHGRDAPPNRDLFTRRGRFLRSSEHDEEFIQVNRPLDNEFSEWISARDWHLCLLQECPPRWGEMLAVACDAQALRVMTSRNFPQVLRSRLARWNPDLMASGEGGSNLILVRRPWSVVQGTATSLLLNRFPQRGLRERRVLGAAQIACGDDPLVEVEVANFHASANRPDLAASEVLRAAAFLARRANGRPMILAGDFNVRPHEGDTYAKLRSSTGLAGVTHDRAIDHVLSRGLKVLETPHQLPADERDLEASIDGVTRKLRLSDHAPIIAQFGVEDGRPS